MLAHIILLLGWTGSKYSPSCVVIPGGMLELALDVYAVGASEVLPSSYHMLNIIHVSNICLLYHIFAIISSSILSKRVRDNAKVDKK